MSVDMPYCQRVPGENCSGSSPSVATTASSESLAPMRARYSASTGWLCMKP